MPDSQGFTHEPDHGNVYHRCVECGWPGWGVYTTKAERRKHHEAHRREEEKLSSRTRMESLRAARKAQEQIRRENDMAYGDNTEEAI